MGDRKESKNRSKGGRIFKNKVEKGEEKGKGEKIKYKILMEKEKTDLTQQRGGRTLTVRREGEREREERREKDKERMLAVCWEKDEPLREEPFGERLVVFAPLQLSLRSFGAGGRN